ncbi:uncharacterized protein TRIADDRAFT_25794, partial [Trichoplax adhaerens]
QINLKLILVTGKTHEFLFLPETAAGDITQHVFNNWPPEWEDEAVDNSSKLRLIYQGRFLQNESILSSMRLPAGKTTVMHLVARENIPEPSSQGINPILTCYSRW